VLLGNRVIQHCPFCSCGGIHHAYILRCQAHIQQSFTLIGLGLFQHSKWFVQLLLTTLKNVMTYDENLGIKNII